MQVIAIRVQRIFQGVEDINSDILGRGITIDKCRVPVEVPVVQIVNYGVNLFFQGLEIDPHAQVVELGCPDRYPDLPVVAVGVFAVAGIITQVMTAGKMGLYKNIHKKTPVGRKSLDGES